MWAKWILGIVAFLVGIGIVGGIRIAIGQSALARDVETNRNIIASREAVVGKVNVIEANLDNITARLSTIKNENDAAHKKLEDRMEINKREILEAIKRN